MRRMMMAMSVCAFGVWTPAATADEPTREGPCAAILEVTAGPDKGRFTFQVLPGFSALGATAAAKTITVPAPDGHKALSLLCTRSSPVPATNDDRVVHSGYALTLASLPDMSRKFMVTLSKDGDRLTYTVENGALTGAETKATAARLEAFNAQ